MSDDTLLGVVTPTDQPAVWRDDEEALEAQSMEREGLTLHIDGVLASEFEVAAALVDQQLSRVRTRLQTLRAEREQINEQIRQLVEDEELLQRMARVRRGQRGPRRETTDEA